MKPHNAALLLTVLALLSSCFKDEPAEAECDIVQAYIRAENPKEMFFNVSDTLVNVLYTSDSIVFNVRKNADLTALAPEFVITEGASIEPASGSVQDFSRGGVLYTVTSEDGNWRRAYKVSFRPTVRIVSDTLKFDFEEFRLEEADGKYYEWLNTDTLLPQITWATANPGFRISKGSAAPLEYPTTPLSEGYDGAAVKLTTLSTGSLGKMVKKPIAAGNLFIGELDLKNILGNSMLSTRFGVRFDRIPVKLSGWYKYKAGGTFTDKDSKVLEGRTDSGTIYGVLYKNHDEEGNPFVLYGDNVLTSPQIVSVAKLGDIHDTEEWTEFELDFESRGEVDEELLNDFGYSFTFVCSSSKRGEYFEGAVGSTLMVDKVRVVCKEIEE